MNSTVAGDSATGTIDETSGSFLSSSAGARADSSVGVGASATEGTSELSAGASCRLSSEDESDDERCPSTGGAANGDCDCRKFDEVAGSPDMALRFGCDSE